MSTALIIPFFYLLLFLLMQSFFEDEKKLRKNKVTSNNTRNAVLMFCLGLLARLLMSNIIRGYPADMSCFEAWSGRLSHGGPINFYAPDYFADYPPLYMLVLYFVGLINRFANSSPYVTVMLLKLPSMLADVGLAAMVYFWGRSRLGNKQATALSFMLLISPMMLLNSTFWGQIDSFFTIVLVASVYMVYGEKYSCGAFLYALAALIKPQAFIIAPLYLCAYFETKDFKMIGKSAAIGLATIFVAALPFTRGFNFLWLYEKYSATLASYPYATVNAFGIYGLFGYNWRPITDKFIFIPVSIWSNVAILLTVVLSIWFYFKSSGGRDKLFFMGHLIIVTLFIFGAKMHERYMFPAVLLLLFCYIFNKDKKLLYLFIAQSTIQFINCCIVLQGALNNNTGVSGNVMFIFSFIGICIYAYTIYVMFKLYMPNMLKDRKPFKRETFVPGSMVRIDYIVMACITLFYSLAAFYQLGDTVAPQTFYHTTQSEITVDLGRSEDVSSMILYFGIGDGSKNYEISKSNDGVNWESYTVVAHGSVFAWSKVKTEATARYFKILPEHDGMMLGELGILDKDEHPLPYTTNIPEINDEQDVVPAMPSYMNGSYFDEVYHPRTAYEVLHKIAPFENTHPPLGKLIIGMGVKIFGMTPFGWRFMGTLAGILMLPAFYLFAKKLFNSTVLSGIGTFVFAFDFMHFAQTRLATIDSYAVLFIIIMYYFLTRYIIMDFNKTPVKKGLLNLGLAGMFFGIGAASKWVCLYAAFGMAFLLFYTWIKAYFANTTSQEKQEYKKKIIQSVAWCVLFFVIVPLFIYSASYIPAMSYDLNGRTPLQYIVGNQTYMLWYHGEYVPTLEKHSFASNWYEWMIVKRPLWAYLNSDLRSEGIASSIASFGNPAVWWVGTVALVLSLFIAWKKRGLLIMLIIVPFLSQLLPWVAVTRMVWIYHYFASVPFMIFAILYLIKALQERYHVPSYVFYTYCGVVFALFIMFFPVLSGMEVPIKYFDYLKWFNTWSFI